MFGFLDFGLLIFARFLCRPKCVILDFLCFFPTVFGHFGRFSVILDGLAVFDRFLFFIFYFIFFIFIFSPLGPHPTHHVRSSSFVWCIGRRGWGGIGAVSGWDVSMMDGMRFGLS